LIKTEDRSEVMPYVIDIISSNGNSNQISKINIDTINNFLEISVVFKMSCDSSISVITSEIEKIYGVKNVIRM
jgi:acetolactate synthase regulatory subunit